MKALLDLNDKMYSEIGTAYKLKGNKSLQNNSPHMTIKKSVVLHKEITYSFGVTSRDQIEKRGKKTNITPSIGCYSPRYDLQTKYIMK